MILIDTNVVSETMRAAPDAAVVEWLDRQAVDTLYFSTISLAELLYGVALLPTGHRKVELAAALSKQVELLFQERMLFFDVAAANAYATLMSEASRSGRAVGVVDGQIAAIALTHRLVVATRDTAPFEVAGLRIVNPWLHARKA
jgi:predicted nucleic acid-binding protein